jgi:DNA-binding transcriptional LysR family regulator
MQLDSTKIEAFAALASYLNFSRAANVLNITQPALSKKIAKLEDEMGVSLFIRTKRSVELTPAGLELVNYWKSKLEIDREFLERIGGVNKIAGTVKIASFSTLTSSCIIPALADFFAENPGLNLELYTKETKDLPGLLLGGTVDLILHDEVINRENIDSELIAEETLVHVQPKGPARDWPYLDHDINDKITLSYLRAQGIRHDIRRLFVDDIHSIISGVKSGLGQAVISRHLYAPETMKRVHAKKTVLSPVYLCSHRRSYTPKLISEVMELLKKNLGKFTH